jgi:hypothetical protein
MLQLDDPPFDLKKFNVPHCKLVRPRMKLGLSQGTVHASTQLTEQLIAAADASINLPKLFPGAVREAVKLHRIKG